MSRPRRDPRAEWRAHRVPGPKPRYDRLRRAGGADPGGTGADPDMPAAAPRSVIIEAPAYLVAVAADLPDGLPTPLDRQLLGAARALADQGGGAVVVLARAPWPEAGEAGADRLCVTAAGEDDPAGQAAAIAAFLAGHPVRAALFGETADGGDVARRTAALLDRPLFAGVEAIGGGQAIRPARAMRVEQRRPAEGLMTIRADSVAPYRGHPHEARSLPAPATKPPPAGERIAFSPLPHDPGSLPLAEAELVVSAGNGVTDFAAFHRLARALRATPGASRVVCDRGDMPRDRQVGASGTVLDARGYLAFGIAGAPQHLQGIAGVEHVVAVNTDLHAAMVARAGLSIIADAQAVMPALTAALDARKADA